MERSFKKEVQALKLGDGETFHGEGILAVTKALLQSGVSYVGGYQGAPVSHLLDVLVDAEDIMSELGVHLETCSNEASAAAMLGASINYPLRGAVTWKSIVGTNVAADALSNLVPACKPCNHRKSSRTPEQATMPLLYAPYVPSLWEDFILRNRRILADQMEFLMAHLPQSSRLHDT